MSEEEQRCWLCDSPAIVYFDVLDLGWCEPCFREEYMK